MVLNLSHRNGLSYLPGNCKEKKIGPRSSKYIAKAIIIHKGREIINPKRDKKISKGLFKKGSFTTELSF